MKKYTDAELAEIARNIRIDIVMMLNKSKSGHTGGSLSAVEILTTLYFDTMDLTPDNFTKPAHDRFVLSKGHATPVYYATLSRAGFFDRSLNDSFRTLGGKLQGHPDRFSVPGIEASTGSLGQGLSIANGMALSMRLDNLANRVYCLLGDGELQEGQVWEAAMTAPHYKLDNLVAIVDANRLQIDGEVAKVKNIMPIVDKFKAFGWNVIAVDGHSIPELKAAFEKANTTKGKPTCIVADTVKGKGCTLFENKASFHGVAPNDAELAVALKELGGSK